MWEGDALFLLGLILGGGALIALYFLSGWVAQALDAIVGLIGLICLITGWAIGKIDEKVNQETTENEQSKV